MITYSEAIDEIFTTVTNTVETFTPTFIDYEFPLRFVGIEYSTKPDRTKYWARVSTQIVSDQQASLSDVEGQRFYEAISLLYIQLFCPRNVSKSLQNGRKMAEILQDQFRRRSTSDELWYRNPRIVELPETAEAYPINIVSEFWYKSIAPAVSPN